MGLLGDVFDAVGDAVDVIQTSVGTVLGIVTEVHKQVDIVDNLVSQPLRGIVQKIQAGQMWRGPNADDFLSVCQKDYLTEAVSASQGLGGFGGALDNASKAVADADLQAAGIAEELMNDATSIISLLNQGLTSK